MKRISDEMPKLREDDSCPACGGKRVVEGITVGDGAQLDACIDCHRIWERETRANPALEPCGNCAWLPGSPEAESGEIYGIIDKTLYGGVVFYCHKRVPFALDGKQQFDHQVEGKRCVNASVCAGYIRAKIKEKQFIRETEHEAEAQPAEEGP